MTDTIEAVALKLRADLDEATKQHMPAMVVTTDYLRSVLDTIAALRAELARVKEALQWSVDRAPGNADGGLAYVTLTWDQFNEMRDIALGVQRSRAAALSDLIAGDAGLLSY